MSIADVLLAQEDEAGPLRDILFRASVSPDPIRSAGPVSDQLALSYLRKSLPHATAIAASPGVSPEVLRRFAKDGRVAVRRALITNPSTPPDALLELMKWACERGNESPEMFSQVDRLDAGQIVELSRFVAEKNLPAPSISVSNMFALASKLMADGDAFEQVTLTSFRLLGETMASLVLSGAGGSRTLSDVVARICRGPDGEDRARKAMLVRSMLSSGGILTHELIDMWDASLAPTARARTGHLRPAALVEPGVLERLAAGSGPRLDLALVNRAPEHVIRERIPGMDLEDVALVAGTLGWGGVTPAGERALASRLLELAADPSVAGGATDPSLRDRFRFAAEALVMQSHSVLPEHLLLGALRLGGMQATAAWLSPEDLRIAMPDGSVIERRCVQPCRAGTLAALVADPGFALERSYGPYRIRSRAEGWPGLMSELLDAAAASPEHGAAVAEALGSKLSGYALYNGAAAMYPYIRSRLGEDAHAWETFLEMSRTWAGSLGELLDTTRVLTGR